MPPGRVGDFPERLLSLFSQQPPRRFVTADGDEYRLCETTIMAADPAAAWAALEDRCMPPPEQPIRDLASYRAFLRSAPSRWWCQPADDTIDYIGNVEPGKLTNLGTVRRGTDGSFTLTANSQPRAAALTSQVTDVAPDTKVTGHSARTAQELADEPGDAAAGPDTGQAERRRRGVRVPPPSPVTLIVEQYFIPLQHGRDELAAEISRSDAEDKMLAARDEEGLTPAEAFAAGGAALDRLRALLDDCEWQWRRADEAGERTDLLPDPAELRRRIGLRPA